MKGRETIQPREHIRYSFVPNHRVVMEALAKSSLSGREFRAVILILNQTNGYLREEDTIKTPFFLERTGIPRKHLADVLHRLEQWRVITRRERIFKVNPPQEWAPEAFAAQKSPKMGTPVKSPKTGEKVPENGDSIPENGDFSATSKENLSKENLSPLRAANAATFDQWLAFINGEKNKPAALYEMCVQLFPGWQWNGGGSKSPPEIARIGAMVKRSDAGSLCRQIWRAAADRPVGDPLSYVQKMGQGGHHERAEAGVRGRDTGQGQGRRSADQQLQPIISGPDDQA